MTVASRATLKTYFQTGDRPTQSQFIDLIDSLVSMNDADASIAGAKTFTGNVGINGTLGVIDSGANANNGINFVGTLPGGGVTQRGIGMANLTATTSATTSIEGIYAGITTAAGSYTTADVANIGAAGITKGASHTITRAWGLYINHLTVGTNNADLFIGGGPNLATTFTGTWSIYNNASADVYLGAANTFINDTANANMTLGLTINQGANDNEILALKSSDVAHGLTGVTETDTYGAFAKEQAPTGGLGITGIRAAASSGFGLVLRGIVSQIESTRSTAAGAGVHLDAALISGTSKAAMGADGNMVAFFNNGSAKFIFDSDGDSHEDGTGWTAYDDCDDVSVLNAVNTVMTDPIRTQFQEWVREHRAMIEALPGKPLIVFNADGHHFINRSKMQELLVGAVRQLGARLTRAERALLAAGINPGLLN